MESQTESGQSPPRRSPLAGYNGEERPLGGYATLVTTFGVAVAGAAAAARAAGREAPERVQAQDIVLMGLATHKLSRLITKDKVTSFLRAPFTEYQAPAGHGEVEERPRGRGLRLAVGELLVCPYCLGQWLSAGFVAGSVLAPRPTRMVAATFAIETVADFLQLAYRAAEERA